MDVTEDFTQALRWIATWTDRDAEIAVGHADLTSRAMLEGRLTTQWDSAVMVANGFDDAVILRVGQRSSVALLAEEFERAERSTDGLRLYLRGLEVTIGEPMLLQREP